MSYVHVWERKNDEYRAEALERLRELLPPGSTVTCAVRHVVRSGMARTITVLVPDGRPGMRSIRNVSTDVARVLDWKIDNERGGVYVTGYGMDMEFHLVYSLARTLYGHLSKDEVGIFSKTHPNVPDYVTDAGYLLNKESV